MGYISCTTVAHSTKTCWVYVTCFFLEGGRGTTFSIEAHMRSSPRRFSFDLKKDQLLFLINEPIKYGKCGHVSLHKLPNDRFEIRDEYTLAHYADYCPDIHIFAYRASLRVNGPVHNSVKLMTRKLLHEMFIVSPYVRDVSVDTIVLSALDAPLIKRLMASYVHKQVVLGWKRKEETYEAAVDREISNTTVDKLNKYIGLCNLSISPDFDLRAVHIGDLMAMMGEAERIDIVHVLTTHAFQCRRILNK